MERFRSYRPRDEWEVFDQPAGWATNQMYVDELTCFLHCVCDGTDTFSNVEHGRAALRIALAAKEQAAQGRGKV